jgi:hypothetical protein
LLAIWIKAGIIQNRTDILRLLVVQRENNLMSSVEKAYETQIQNIQKKTGKSLTELTAIIQQSGLSKHGEIRAMLQKELGLGYGDANSLVHAVLQSDGERAAQAKGLTQNDVLEEIYTGAKAGLRPIHEQLVEAIQAFGEFEVAPKKGYVSLRREKQFAMIGPATNTRIEVGLNIKNLSPHERLVEVPPGGMCNYKVKLTQVGEVNDELLNWLRQAYDSAG